MEPHGQSLWFPRDAHKGRTSRTRGLIRSRVETVVLLVRDRLYPISCKSFDSRFTELFSNHFFTSKLGIFIHCIRH